MNDATPTEGWTAVAPNAGRRAAVLDAVRRSDQTPTIADLAARLRLHPNTVRFHLKTLIRGGQVEQVTGARGTPGRPAQTFRAVRARENSPRQYRVLAEMLIDGVLAGPDPGARAVAVGRRWGRRYGPGSAGQDSGSGAEPVDQLVGLLDDLGFDPERGSGEASVVDLRLRNCPFLELASTHPEVTCGIHLGVMQGAVAGAQPAVAVTGLDRFPEPGVCIAHLLRR